MALMWGLLLTLTLLPCIFAVSMDIRQLYSMLNLTEPVFADPPFNPFQLGPTQASKGLIEIKRLPANPLTTSWAFFTFMSHNKAILPTSQYPSENKLSFAFVYGSSRSDCTLPRVPLNLSPFPVGAFPHNDGKSSVCIAVDRAADPSGLSPMIAGQLDATDECRLNFTPTAHIPPQWEITCLIQFTSATVVSLPRQKLQLIDWDSRVSENKLNSYWTIKEEEDLFPTVAPLKQALVWLRLEADYRAGEVKSLQRIDQLVIKFTKLPPNVALRLEFAFDVNNVDRLDRLMFLSDHICRVWAEMMQAIDLPTTNFETPKDPSSARFVYSRPVASYSEYNQEGFYVITGENPPQSVEFNLPVPIYSILGRLLVPRSDQISQEYWEADQWHGKNIATYIRVQQQRLFRFDSTHSRAKWNFQTPLLQQYYHVTPRNFQTLTPLADHDTAHISTHIIVMGRSPSVQITNYRGPSLDQFSFEKLFKPVADQGYFVRAAYATSPANSLDLNNFIPLALTTPSSGADQFTFQPHVFEFSSESHKAYSGYANITIAFAIPTNEVYPFSIDLLINGQFRRSISIYPALNHKLVTSSASNELLQLQTTITPSHSLLDLGGPRSQIRSNQNYINIENTDRANIPVLWDFRFTELELGSFEMRSPNEFLPSCSGFYSTTLYKPEEIMEVERKPLDSAQLFAQYNIPYDSTTSPLQFSYGVVKEYLPVLSKDLASWVGLKAYTFPNTDIVFTCDYALDPTIDKTSALHATQLVQNVQSPFPAQKLSLSISTPQFPPGVAEKAQDYVHFEVFTSFPITSNEDFSNVLDSFVTILTSSTYAGPDAEVKNSLEGLTRDKVFIANDPAIFSALSYQYSLHPSSMMRNLQDFGPEKRPLHSYSQYNTANLIFSVPFEHLNMKVEVINHFRFMPHKGVMVKGASNANSLCAGLRPTYLGSGPAQPHASLLIGDASCYSSSSCAGKCIKGKCITTANRFRIPSLTVLEAYILDQYQFHQDWLYDFVLPNVPDDLDEVKESHLFAIIMAILGALALVAISLLACLCYSRHKQHKLGKTQDADLEQVHHDFQAFDQTA